MDLNAKIRDRAYPGQIAVSVVSIALLILGIAGWCIGNVAARGTGFFLFALVGFGSAVLIVLRQRDVPLLALSAPLGLAIVLLIGFVLVEARVWFTGPVVFTVLAVIAGGAHLAYLARDIRYASWPGRTAFARKQVSAVANEIEVAAETSKANQRIELTIIGLTLVGLAGCLLSAARLMHFNPGPSGLFTAISPAWYVGLALIVVAIIVGQRSSVFLAGLPVVALTLAVTLTPAIIYDEPRYSWTFKHIGLTAYILAHGNVNANLNIYMSWPGLFAGVAWLCRVSGIHDPTVVARFWPTVIDLASVLAFQYLAFRVLRDGRRAWLAAAVLLVGNTIGQDYFSPQAAGFLIAIALFAVAIRRRGDRQNMVAGEWVIFTIMAVALAVTHQLSPYMVTAALVVLVVFGQARSWLLPLIVVLPAAGWASLHLSIISKYFNFSEFGSITTNVLTKGLANPNIHKGVLIRLDALTMAGDALVIGLVAVAALTQRRTRLHIALALCALSSAGLLVANSYGNEGSFRVLLFAIPWLAVLAMQWRPPALLGRQWLWAALIPVLLGAYLFADMGLDYMEVVRPGDLQALRAFEDNAPQGSRLSIIGAGYSPTYSTGRYHLIKEVYYPYIADVGISQSQFNPTLAYEQFMKHSVPKTETLVDMRSFYVLTDKQAKDATRELGAATALQYDELREQITESPSWKLVTKTSTASLFVLQSGPYLASLPVSSTTNPLIPGPLHCTVAKLSPRQRLTCPPTAPVEDGEVLYATRGVWQSPNKLTFRYKWELCDSTGSSCAVILGATHRSYRLQLNDIGKKVTVVVSATDQEGKTGVAAATPVGPVGNSPPPLNTVLPVISGTLDDGQVLHTTDGRWQSANKLKYTYKWERCDNSGTNCAAIPRAVHDSYRLRALDIGSKIAVVVTATNQEFQSSIATASSVGPVGNPPPPLNIVKPVIKGVTRDGQVLVTTDGRWQGLKKLTFSFKWERCDSSGTNCTAIAGAIHHAYRLQARDNGSRLTVVVTATDPKHQIGTASAPTVGPVTL